MLPYEEIKAKLEWADKNYTDKEFWKQRDDLELEFDIAVNQGHRSFEFWCCVPDKYKRSAVWLRILDYIKYSGYICWYKGSYGNNKVVKIYLVENNIKNKILSFIDCYTPWRCI